MKAIDQHLFKNIDSLVIGKKQKTKIGYGTVIKDVIFKKRLYRFPS